MNRKVTCLKERKEYYKRNISLDTYYAICREYGKKLESEGWTLSVIEGGCISPDNSTIYIYFRGSYEGELLNLIPNTEKEYEKICNEFIAKGDFIDEEEIWKEMALEYSKKEKGGDDESKDLEY